VEREREREGRESMGSEEDGGERGRRLRCAVVERVAGGREAGRRTAWGDASGRPRERAARETRGKKKKHEESRQLLPACATGCIVPLLVFLNETRHATGENTIRGRSHGRR